MNISWPLICAKLGWKRVVSLVVTGMLAGFALPLASGQTRSSSSDRPAAGRLRVQAELCRELLKRSLIDFYLPDSLEMKHGGYRESLRDGQFALTGERFLTHQARQLWFFSTLAAEDLHRDEALRAARHGFEFIQKHMLDREHGGYFSKVTDEGGERDPRKHAYLNAFALYGLSAYYRATRDVKALEAARNLFELLDQKAYDRGHGGYIEFFYRDWKPVVDPKESGYVGAIGHKTYNTHLHLMEAMAELYRVWPEERVARRLEELVLINVNTVRHPRVSSNVDAWFSDWRMVEEPRNLRASYGHDVECVWLVLDAVQTLGRPLAPLRNWAEALCRTSIELGYDRQHGGFYASGPLGEPADETQKTWWVQAEALVSMLAMYRLTGDSSYYQLFTQTLGFVERFQIAAEGGWWSTRTKDGMAVPKSSRTGPWHAAYHGGRALILCSKWLGEEASKGQ